MLSLNLKFAVVVILMQQSCSSLDVELAKYLLSEAIQLFSQQEEQCQRASGTAVFINPVEKISC